MSHDDEHQRDIEIYKAQHDFYVRLAAIGAGFVVLLVAILAIWGH